VKLNEQATFWLDSWVNPKTNTNATARENAKAIALHIAALQAHIQELEGENASLRGEDPPEPIVLCSSCYGTGIGIGDEPCMACRGSPASGSGGT
jgi:hypothetical protein